MVYETWTVGGKTVSHVRNMKNNPETGVLVLSCSALDWNELEGDTDPRDEIAYFEAMASQYITNKPLMNGGTKLQVSNGQIITVTDGTDTWSKCGLKRIEINEDKKSTRRIDYDLTISYELEGVGGSMVYTPDYSEYTNIDYYCWTDHSATEHVHCGTEIGEMTITEGSNVKKVEVYGVSCCGPAWLEVNGQRQYWSYSHDGQEGDTLSIGSQKLSFELETPTDEVNLLSSTHTPGPPTPPATVCDINHGCWLQWVRVIYE